MYETNGNEVVKADLFPTRQPAGNSSLASVEQSRAVAEVQASIVLARANPRDERSAFNAVMNSCKRPTLAKVAEYRYKRGTSMVTGPSIRLAEVIARSWGNITYGFREVGRSKDGSEVEAFCHDLETNTRVVRQFQAKHWRDTKGGGYAITEERDKYEYVANMAQRRVRACILEIIPGDVVDAALAACRETLAGEIKDIPKKTEEILRAFDEIGVTKDDIEAYLQRSIKSIVAVDIINLRGVFTSIRDGIASKEEFFGNGKDKAKNRLSEKFAGDQEKKEEKKPEPKTDTTKPANTGADKGKRNEPEPKKKEEPAEDPEPIDQNGYNAEVAKINKLSGTIEIDKWRMNNAGRLENSYNNATLTAINSHISDVYSIFKKEEEEAEQHEKGN